MIKTLQNMLRGFGRKKAVDPHTYRLLEMNRKLSIKKGR